MITGVVLLAPAEKGSDNRSDYMSTTFSKTTEVEPFKCRYMLLMVFWILLILLETRFPSSQWMRRWFELMLPLESLWYWKILLHTTDTTWFYPSNCSTNFTNSLSYHAIILIHYSLILLKYIYLGQSWWIWYPSEF